MLSQHNGLSTINGIQKVTFVNSGLFLHISKRLGVFLITITKLPPISKQAGVFI